MDVFEAIKSRRTIRKYSSKHVENEKVVRVLEAARLAPSAGNAQEWKFIAVRDEKTRMLLTKATLGQDFVGGAPVILVACGTNPERVMACGQHRYTVDLSIATSFMILEAWEQGLGTCWLGRFDEKMVKDILGIPEAVRVVTMATLGYPEGEPELKPRKSPDEVICFDRYS